MRKQCFLVFILPIFFFLVSLYTVGDYGVNWDTLQHFVRGQIYYHYFKTGEKEISQKSEKLSFYEQTPLSWEWTEKMTIGHPPLTDILLAFSNDIFYKKLGLVGDKEGYHVFIIFATFVMSCIVGVWSYQIFGLFASSISVISLYGYPLLFGEQHFNMKDPIVAMYFTGFMYSFWMSITRKRVSWMLAAALFCGLSLGTKFNIIFAPFILLCWFFFYYFSCKKNTNQSFAFVWKEIFSWSMILSIVVGIPIISYVLFFVSYPALWSDPVGKTLSVISYYRDIGGSRCMWYPGTIQWFFCSDIHTLRLFVTSLPIVTIFLSFVGMIVSFLLLKKNHTVALLWTLWLIITLGRATLPITVLYGGSLRQIMEFIAPTALLAGAGAWYVRGKIVYSLKKIYKYISLKILYVIVSFIFFFGFLSVFYSMILLHPNENLYYNILIGGVSGAVEKKYPTPGNSFGNAYKQAIDWVNMTLPQNARIGLVMGITSAVPSMMFRPDIQYVGTHPMLTGPDDEYLMDLENSGMDISYFHNIKYVKRFLKPLYEKKVDGVPIVTVWKNDKEHFQDGIDFDHEEKSTPEIIAVSDNEIILKLSQRRRLKRIEFQTNSDVCTASIRASYIFESLDGKTFMRLYDIIAAFGDLAEKRKISAAYGFTGEYAQYLKLYSFSSFSCDLKTVVYSVYNFD